jgi:SAM-dependent methyltransferase
MIHRERLEKLLSSDSKHGNYHALPARLKNLLGLSYNPKSLHYEEARLRFILEHIDPNEKSALDIGANTGFFSFEMIDAGANYVKAYEGNPLHAEFISMAAAETGLSERLTVESGYFDFTHVPCCFYDLTLLLNVLHHTGDDYGARFTSVAAAKDGIIEQINSVSAFSRSMVFQMGFNWKGNPDLPLFRNGTKREMIRYIEEGVLDHWDIVGIGIARRDADDNVRFDPLDMANIERDDSLGEFLNRPLFIMKSKYFRDQVFVPAVLDKS